MEVIKFIQDIFKSIMRMSENKKIKKVKKFLESTQGESTNLEEIKNNTGLNEDDIKSILQKLEQSGYIINNMRDLTGLTKEFEWISIRIIN